MLASRWMECRPRSALVAGAMGTGVNGPDATQSSSASSQPPIPPSQLISASPSPLRAGRYRGEYSLRSSVSVPTFATYWKVPIDENGSFAIPISIPASDQAFEDGSTYPKSPKLNKSGSGNSNGLPGSPPSSPRWWLKGFLISLFVAAGFFLLYLGFLLGTNYLQQEALQFAIVIDGGSTGTRVHVYGWAHSPNDPLPVMVKPTTNLNTGAPLHGSTRQQGLYNRFETQPGLDKLYHNVTGIQDVLVPLLDWAGKHVPRYAHSNTQVFLLATAGLRRLQMEQSDWILDQAWSVLAKSPFRCKRSSVKVIKGIEEAYYGWIALNYNFGRLGHVSKQPNLGALDLGGSSLEVTFEPTEMPRGVYGVNLSVGGTDHHLYAMSHAGFGLNDAFEKSVAELLLRKGKPSKNNRVELKHPCLQTGYKKLYKCSTHCMLPPVGAQGPRRQAPGAEPARGAQVDLLGAPDWKACQALAEQVINSTEIGGCNVPPCALGKHQPLPQGQFYGLAGFFIVYKFFGLSHDAPLNELLVKGRDFCKLPWKEAERSVEPQPSIEHYCFRSPYVVALFRQGLHLHDDQIRIGSGDFAWTLGAALWEAGALKPVQKSRASQLMNSHSAVGLGVLLLLLLILFVVTCCHRRQMRLGRRGYLPLYPATGSSAIWMPTQLRNQGRLGSITNGALGRGELLLSPGCYPDALCAWKC